MISVLNDSGHAEFFPSEARAAQAKHAYPDAVRDWAMHGAASRHVYAAQQARARLALPDGTVALANAHFRFGFPLHRVGLVAEGDVFLRQAMNLREIVPLGFAADEAFFARVDALGAARYYPSPDLEGYPTELGFTVEE